MRNEIKLGLYVVLLIGTCVFGALALSSYRTLMHQPSDASRADLSEVPALNKDEGQRTRGGYARMLTFGVVFFVSVVGLGLLAGRDAAHYFGNRFVKELYDDEGEGFKSPEYDAAEQVWADGHHLEAIRMMREYLKKNPREQHVALRIAEIYEKDLSNPLAAALEYEEVLQQKLPAERWGWGAIHLVNLYSKLNQHDKAVALLQRIVSEYPDTAAAEKARKRLEELGFAVPDQPALEETRPPEPPSSGPKLPPGFTLKKT
jgi:tetratricopeptide (TPR) repeat protein